MVGGGASIGVMFVAMFGVEFVYKRTERFRKGGYIQGYSRRVLYGYFDVPGELSEV